MTSSPYPTVLVGTDGSDSSLRAADRAAVIARDAAAVLVIACGHRPVSEREVDLVVIGDRGLNDLAGRVPGSVPANTSHRASRDVLVVHTTGHGATGG